MAFLRRSATAVVLTVLAALTLLMCVGRGARAQATVTVSPTDEVYRAIELLIAHGLVDGVIVGQRPLPRREIARIIASAAAGLARRDSVANGAPPAELDVVRAILATMSADYAYELSALGSRLSALRGGEPRAELRPIERVSVDYTSISGSSRPIPVDNGLGSIDGWIAPFAAERQGRVVRNGRHVNIESAHRFQSRRVAVEFAPRFVAPDYGTGSSDPRGALQNLQLRLLLGNLAIEAGREYVVWGQGRDVGLLGSNAAPGLDLVKLSTERAARLPWVLRGLGPTRASIFFADLGARQNFPESYFVGYKVSILPSPRFETGITVYTKAGGHGGPRATFSARVLDAFPFLQAAFYDDLIGVHNTGDFSDRYAGVDARWRFPRWRGLAVFGELLLNDFDVRRISSVLWEDAGHVAGMVAPRLGPGQRWTLSTEVHHTGIRFYRHHQFTSGQTFERQLIGDPLGPDALGWYLDVERVQMNRARPTLSLAVERRSNDQYMLRTTPGGEIAFERMAVEPKEWRYRAVASWRGPAWRPGLWVTGQLGVERTRNFGFVDAQERTGAFARIQVEYRVR